MRAYRSFGLPALTILGSTLAGGFSDVFESWTAPPPPPPPPSRRGARKRSWWLAAAAVPVCAVVAVWVGIRELPWFGPLLADTLRATIGSEAVTQLEELSAGVEDRVRLTVGSAEARGLAESTPDEIMALARVAPVKPAERAFRPRDVEPMFPAVASAEDGKWLSVPVVSGSGEPLHRTILHPDAQRPYAELFVFALDLSQLELHLAAGSIEPRRAPTSRGAIERPGRIPDGDAANVIAAFNGGFKSEHGHFGMMVDGVELLPAKAGSCTVAAGRDGSLRIGTWSNLAPEASSFAAWRQTPACMAEAGKLHPGLRGDTTNWGATIDGNTVIRRSAIGLDRDRKTLFVGISNATTARALATGMMHAGAFDVAQLDVNHSFPKFVLYGRDDGGKLTAMTAVKGFMVERDAYVGRPSTRDFFYVTSRAR